MTKPLFCGIIYIGKGEGKMPLRYLLTFLRMCGYDYKILAVYAPTGEVVRFAPLKYFGIKGTALAVKSFDFDKSVLVVYLE